MTCDPKHEEPIEEPIIVPDDLPTPVVPERKKEYEPSGVPG